MFMGINYEVGCTHCTYNSILREGIGPDINSFENVLKKYKVDEKKLIKSIIKKYGLKSKSRLKNPRYEKNPFYEERIYKCRVCGNIESQLYIRISAPEKWMFEKDNKKYLLEKNILFRTRNKCTRCDTRLRHCRENIDQLDCPECKKAELQVLSKKSWN